MEFVNLPHLHDSCPIVLIDMSGSAERPIKLPGDFNSRTVIDYEIEIVKRLFASTGISQIYLGFWNYQLQIASQNPINISTISSYKPKQPFGSTLLNVPLKSIPQHWLQNKSCSELYIFTDGEIEDGDKITNQLKYLNSLKTKIQIITVEPNSINYLNSENIAGSTIYKAIKDNNLTSIIRRFSSYNEYHTHEPFISFDNPEQVDGYAIFDGKYFQIANSYDDFLDHVDERLASCESNNAIYKMAHDLTLTINHITKNKSHEEQNKITQEITDLFSNTTIDLSTFNKINTLLITESENHTKGQSTIFQEFRNALVVKN